MANLSATNHGMNPTQGFKNKVFNPNFDIWQRGTSQTSSGYGSDDRWNNTNAGTTKTTSRQTFTLGQTDVPGNPKYYSRTVVSSVAGAANQCHKYQPIERVSTFSGETVTLSFWAKADSSKNIATEFTQYFGTGGSPSSEITAIGATTHALTSSWQKFTVTVDIPSISGKTLGTDDNDNLRLVFWFDAGSNFNARSNSLGQQSGTFDTVQVQLEEGSVATEFEYRSVGEELALCKRYYEAGKYYGRTPSVAAGGYTGHGVLYAVEKRAAPTVALANQFTSDGWSSYSVDTSWLYNTYGVGISVGTSGGSTASGLYYCTWTADAEL